MHPGKGLLSGITCGQSTMNTVNGPRPTAQSVRPCGLPTFLHVLGYRSYLPRRPAAQAWPCVRAPTPQRPIGQPEEKGLYSQWFARSGHALAVGGGGDTMPGKHAWPTWMSVTAAFFIMMAAASALPAPAAEADLVRSVYLEGHTIEFLGVSYDGAAKTSTWSYRVTGSDPALSLLKFELCAAPQQRILAASHPYERGRGGRFGPYYGIKFEFGAEDWWKGARVWFTLEGMWEASNVAVTAKAGPSDSTGQIAGPSCGRWQCCVSFTVNQRIDWRIQKPGTYAVAAIQIQLSGSSDVLLRFDDFKDMAYHTQPGMDTDDTPIRVDYAIGDTLADAELFGWRPARQWAPDGFNGLECFVPCSQVRPGTTITVWMRIANTAHHRSAEYESQGTVSVTSLCNCTT